jgi:hypothetical protein
MSPSLAVACNAVDTACNWPALLHITAQCVSDLRVRRGMASDHCCAVFHCCTDVRLWRRWRCVQRGKLWARSERPRQARLMQVLTVMHELCKLLATCRVRTRSPVRHTHRTLLLDRAAVRACDLTHMLLARSALTSTKFQGFTSA